VPVWHYPERRNCRRFLVDGAGCFVTDVRGNEGGGGWGKETAFKKKKKAEMREVFWGEKNNSTDLMARDRGVERGMGHILEVPYDDRKSISSGQDGEGRAASTLETHHGPRVEGGITKGGGLGGLAKQTLYEGKKKGREEAIV